ncbi:hypothetical protein TNCV_2212421 [Trichonephila clavipes]|nr:hypothetical protein TNCV_2212421 [Trichonephila clavipes]
MRVPSVEDLVSRISATARRMCDTHGIFDKVRNSCQNRYEDCQTTSGYLSTTEKIPCCRIRAHFKQLSEFETCRIIGLKDRSGGLIDCQISCHSASFIVINPQTCVPHTIDLHGNSLTANKAKFILVPTATQPDTHACTLSSQITLVLGLIRLDESRFLLYPDNQRRRAWSRTGKLADPAFIIAHHTGSQTEVMVWGFISGDSLTSLVVIRGTLTA